MIVDDETDMAKKVQAMVKLQIAAGKATPAPPVGTALGPQGVNIMDFCKNFNAKTAKDEGLIIPVVVTVYADRSYTLHHEDAAGAGAAEARGEHREGIGRAEQDQGRHGHGEAGRGDREAEDAGPERRVARVGDQDRRGHGAVDGPGCRSGRTRLQI